jgi:ribonuclease-3
MDPGGAVQPLLPHGALMTADADSRDSLADRLGHRFNRPELLETALTHASMGMARRRDTYQRLEFLGDRVLGLAMADLLMRRFPDESEGDLARRYARLVDGRSLAEVAESVDLGVWLRMSDGEAATGSRDNPAILADAMEAVIGAIYRDAGLDVAAEVIARLWEGMLDRQDEPPTDPKTALQEWAQAQGRALPDYRTLGRTGPDHAPRFTVEVAVSGLRPVRAEGGSRRAAERAAAEAALAVIAAGDGNDGG